MASFRNSTGLKQHSRAPSWRVSSAVRVASRSTPDVRRAVHADFLDFDDLDQEIEDGIADDLDGVPLDFENSARTCALTPESNHK